MPESSYQEKHPGRIVRAWTRCNVWLSTNVVVAYIIVVVAIAFAFGGVWEAVTQVKDAQDAISSERDARVGISTELNRYVCNENNKQDRILAKLIAISVASANGKALTPQQERGLRVFQGAFAELHKETPCNLIVNVFHEASDTHDFKVIQRLLRRVDREDREARDRIINGNG